MHTHVIRFRFAGRRCHATHGGECIDVVDHIDLVAPFCQCMGQATNRISIAAEVIGRVEGRNHRKAQTRSFSRLRDHHGMLCVTGLRRRQPVFVVFGIIRVCQNSTRTYRRSLLERL